MPTSLHDRIDSSPAKLGGRPCIRGTRIPVEMIIEELEAGWSVEMVLWEHPRLERDDVAAAIAFHESSTRSIGGSTEAMPINKMSWALPLDLATR